MSKANPEKIKRRKSRAVAKTGTTHSAKTARIPSRHSTELVISCEHATNKIPSAYRPLFLKSQGVLRTHRGWDPGALDVATQISKFFSLKLHRTEVSRLIVDVNRSRNAESALSKWTKQLSNNEQNKIFHAFYDPHRMRVKLEISKKLRKARVLHLGIHSFSPYLDPSRRSCDIGILFDPKSRFEKRAAELLRKNLEFAFPNLGIRMNFPYRGDSDGLTTDLRKIFLPQTQTALSDYAGLEIEFNQSLLRKLAAKNNHRTFTQTFSAALETCLNQL